MDKLNPQQFARQSKMDLGESLNEDHDWATRSSELKGAPTGQAELGYYSQPSNRVRQLALPGMEMSVHDHLQALGKATRTSAQFGTSGGLNQISLLGENSAGVREEWASLKYSNARGRKRKPDSGETHVPDGGLHPGEIKMVDAIGMRGRASAMLETAEKLAREHGYAFPKHSHKRTPDGVAWSQKQMRKRGETVW